jgi:serine/threonine protein kinase
LQPLALALTAGSRLGPYEVIAQIGKGGMGEVYRATDTSLGRHVAIKILPDAFAQDPERLARFEREAKTLAALNHSNIAQIYGLETSGSVRALVMELVEGSDLAQRIVEGPLPLAEVLPIARQIAEALEAAHEQGIVHRDLKPANIMIRPDGSVKVLDFGLAKAFDPADGGAHARWSGDSHASLGVSVSPTMTSPLGTGQGIVLGTAPYMSPEQARGHRVDARADVWAFGCVLFEMLTGARAFEGHDPADAMAAVLKLDPDWSRIPAGAPPEVTRLLRRCLSKDRRKRLQSIGDARLELEEIGTAPTPTASPDAGSKRR